MQTRKKGLALLLALLMVFSLLPVSALAADGCLTTTSAGKAFSTKQGELLTVGLAQYFTDSEGHTLTYSLDTGDYGTLTKIAKDDDGNDVLSFTNPNKGDFTPTITAKCSDGGTASVKLSITVTESAAGDESQYGYDESPADSVTVYVTISSDGMPIKGNDGTVLSHLEVTVPYFDLGNQGLSDFYRYHTENGSGSYVDEEIVQRPTALHLYLYMIGKYYMGLTEEEIKTGDGKVYGADGGYGVELMNGETAYEDSMQALYITGGATSMYMANFWGHDENLMYYRNHVYPLMGPGWGSTADYILLSDGDTIDVAMFGNWSFWQYGAFAAFEQDSFSVAKGNTLTAHTLKYDTKSVADGGTEEFDPITGLNVAVYDEDWEYVADMEPSGEDENGYTYTFDKAGTYYLLALDPNAGETGAESAACYAPATAKVTVTDNSSEPVFDPAEYYKDFDFSCISLDPEGTDYLYYIDESSMYVAHFSNPGEKKVYTVTVPAGTETVYVTYPADFEQNIQDYCALFDANGAVSWDYYAGSDYDYSVTENEDGSHTIALPAAFLMENSLYIAAENDDNYEYFNCFYFVEGDNTPPSTGDDAKVTGVKLDQNALTVERGNTAQLTATVEPATATNQSVTWQSSNMKVATVSKKGVVSALAEGTTTITVTTADGGYQAKCTVTVTDPNKPAVNETDGYYEIANGAQLQWFANEVNASSDNASLNARLTADIDLSGICSSANPWTPIGDCANNRKYSGTFDGQNHKITGLYLENNGEVTNGNSYNTGLFGECDGVTIKNLSVYGTAIAKTRMVGGLAGRTHAISTHRRSTIENCHNYVTLTGTLTNDNIYRHGGLVGSAQETDFIGCSNEVDITGFGGDVGGIVGYAGVSGVTLTNCWNTGHICLKGYQSGMRGVGGLVGEGTNTLTLTNCYNTGAVDFYYRTQKVEQYVGGLVGRFYGSSGTHTLTMTGCYNTGKVSGEYDDNAHMGALVGGTSSSVSNTVEVIASNTYYLEGTAETSGVLTGVLAFNAAGGLTAAELGDSESTVWKDSCPYPVLSSQTAKEHSYSHGVCSLCGKIGECAHEKTEQTYRRHSTNDGKFDELTVCTVCLKTVGETVTEHLYGDADGNGTVNSTDLAVVYGVINGKRTLEGWQSFAADVNADGKIDGVDAVILDSLLNESKITQTELPLDVTGKYQTKYDGTHRIFFTYNSNDFSGTGNCVDADSDYYCDICKGCLHPEDSRKTEYKAHFTSDGKFDERISCTKCYIVFQTIEHLIGDVDGDGRVGMKDAMSMTALLNKTELTDLERLSADLNNDGAVDEIDVVLIQQVYLGNVAQTSLPVTTTLTYTPAEEDEHTVTIAIGETTLEQTATQACADTDGDGKCDKCGDAMIVLPTLKEGYPTETTATVQTGMAYLLSDLQAGKIFAPADGQTLSYKNYYYERSADGGETWDAKVGFSEAIFGMTTIQLTENEAGTYIYRFYASHDGKHFSTDTWTLTLNVEDAPKMNFSFYVGEDYNGNYPVIKLYSVDTDDEGNEVLGEEIADAFLYSNFTDTLPEGETEYDPAQGKLVSNYQMFYATLTAGRYAYRAFALNADTEEYDIALGGMTLNLPTDSNVDGGAGGGTNIYLQCNSFYTNSKKTDNTYFTADEYHVKLDCPIMNTTAAMGDPYVSGSFTYYPTMLYAAGNACLYNVYAYPDIDGYIFSQSINLTYQPSYVASTRSLTINTAVVLTVTVPEEATFGLYFQWNNFNTTEVEPDTTWKDNGDGTKTAEYSVIKKNSNYTWRLTDSDHVTRAGWVNGNPLSADTAVTFSLSSATDRVSHSGSYGKNTGSRDEADLQVNLDPSGFEAITGTTRVRAYRHWELINSDAGNIMIEPDFHWNLETGDADVEPVNGGNAGSNWADVTPGAEDSIITVYYDSVDTGTLNPFNGRVDVGTHGGRYPATQPQRVGVIVVGGTGVTHGSADADVDFNMEPGTTTTRSMDWDYNYDTWFYGANETDPALNFAVTATGDVTVEYAFVAANNAMDRTVTGFSAVEAGEDGRYTVPLAKFGEIGNGMGGTVIIRMTDDTGVSYRLVRVAKVTISAENVSHPEEDIMPGDQVKLTFSGMFRAVNKVSGIFNPTIFKPTYYDGETKYEGELGQYQKMDNTSITVTIPENVEFEDGEDTAIYSFTNGYTYGSMYSAANPFAFLYNMTDAGVGTNFNAVTVNYYMNHYADAAIEVHRKVLYDTQLIVPDASGNALEGVTVTLTGTDGKAVEADENGRFQLGYGTYSYILAKDGYARTIGEFTLSSADAEKLVDGILSITTNAMTALGENAWDGTTKTEPAKDADGVYQIGTASELAWFADAVNGGQTAISAKLTADIELGGFDWTPIGSSSNKYTGTFDGNGHVVKNLYINSTATYQALFGYLGANASLKNFGVTGIVTTTSNFAAGIAAYMENQAVINGCFSSVKVTAAKSAAGIANGQSAFAEIRNCYNTGNITATGTSGLAGGITSGSSSDYTAGVWNSYNTGRVSAAKYYGAITSVSSSIVDITNCYYLDTTGKDLPVKRGTAKTADELKALAATLGDSFVDDEENINSGYPILAWQTNVPAKDAEGYYLLSTVENMQWFAETVNGGTTDIKAKLVNDIDLSSVAWTPIGTKDVPFSGVFDGDGHTVNLVIKKSSSDSYQALFGYMKGENAEIRNLAVTGSVKSTGTYAGTGAQFNAGILGYAESGTVKNCYNAADISGRQNIGGVVGGGDTAAVIDNCYNSGSVTATGNFAGGITSSFSTWGQGPTLSNCYNSGTVTAKLTNGGTRRIGGIACIQAPNKSYGENLYYLDTCLGDVTGEGAAESKTLPELIKLVEAKTEHPFTEAMLAALKALLGDVNGDGAITVADAELVYNYSIGAGTLTEAQILLADMDGDGYITAKDAAMIYAIIAAALATVTE